MIKYSLSPFFYQLKIKTRLMRQWRMKSLLVVISYLIYVTHNMLLSWFYHERKQRKYKKYIIQLPLFTKKICYEIIFWVAFCARARVCVCVCVCEIRMYYLKTYFRYNSIIQPYRLLKFKQSCLSHYVKKINIIVIIKKKTLRDRLIYIMIFTI